MPTTIRSHLLTIAPALRNALAPVPTPRSTPWTTDVGESPWGRVSLTGRMSTTVGSRALVIVVHGLGGSPNSHYCRRFANAARRHGFDSLRVALRGADVRGEDVYHAALAADLGHVIAPITSSRRYERVALVGYSMGGHVALHVSRLTLARSLTAVVAICPPLDLQACQRHLDGTQLYRRNILSGLRASYASCQKKGRVSDPTLKPRSIRTLLDWDSRVIAPRFGFASVSEYYRRCSILSAYADTMTELLVVSSASDPVVPFAAVQDHLVTSSRITHSLLDNQGHVSFCRTADLGIVSSVKSTRGRVTPEDQVLSWIHSRPAVPHVE